MKLDDLYAFCFSLPIMSPLSLFVYFAVQIYLHTEAAATAAKQQTFNNI